MSSNYSYIFCKNPNFGLRNTHLSESSTIFGLKQATNIITRSCVTRGQHEKSPNEGTANDKSSGKSKKS